MTMAADVVDAQIGAYRAKDVEWFLSCYAEDASLVLSGGTPIGGHEVQGATRS
jgi:hypothetical protein